MKGLQLPAHLRPLQPGAVHKSDTAQVARRVQAEQAYVDERLRAGATLALVLRSDGRRVHAVECPYVRDFLDRAEAWERGARVLGADAHDFAPLSPTPGSALALLTKEEFQAHVKVVYKRCRHCSPPVPEARKGPHELEVRARSIADHHVGSTFTGPDGTDLGELVSFRHYTVITTSRGTINLPADAVLIYEKPDP